MPTLAVCQLRQVNLGPAIADYLARVDATLAPHGGRFLVHGCPVTLLEGAWDGDIVIVSFPDRGRAEAWYRSPEYRAILPLRTENADCTAFLVDTVAEDYRAADLLKTLSLA